jgi:5-formyltetrahydrofolate cyclo-ligase
VAEGSKESVGVKTELRKIVLDKLDGMDESVRATASRTIVQEVIALAAYRESSVVLAYASFGSELQTDGFVRSVLDQGKTLVLPKVNRAKAFLDLYEVEDPERDLEAGVWGIPEPRAGNRAVGLDAVEFVLVPGVAFDSRGGRLGHGAGFYDKLLGSSDRRPYLVAGAFENQMVEKVPVDQHDVLMDMVISESEIYPLNTWQYEREQREV